jgi:hypothetical protein
LVLKFALISINQNCFAGAGLQNIKSQGTKVLLASPKKIVLRGI